MNSSKALNVQDWCGALFILSEMLEEPCTSPKHVVSQLSEMLEASLIMNTFATSHIHRCLCGCVLIPEALEDPHTSETFTTQSDSYDCAFPTI